MVKMRRQGASLNPPGIARTDTREGMRLKTMNRWNDEPRNEGANWLDRAFAYLRSRTADHWLMFAVGLIIGAIVS